MRNRQMINLFAGLAFVLSLIGTAYAQSGSIGFPNGITVAIKTETVPPSNSGSLGNAYSSGSTYSGSGNIVHRVMTDTKNKIYFGYDVVVEKQAESEKFVVTIKPLSKTPAQVMGKYARPVENGPDYTKFTPRSLPKFPDPVILNDGDTITLDILENPQTNGKISDIIKVTSKPGRFPSHFSEREKAKDFTIDDVNLLLDAPEILIDGRKSQLGGRASANLLWVYFNGKGRFIFSFVPQPGYDFQKTGMILDNKILFDHNGESYEFINKSPVLGLGGKWNLWVMFDPDYKPSHKLSPESLYEFGGATKVEYLFDKK